KQDHEQWRAKMKNPRQNDCCGEHCVRNSHRGNHDSVTLLLHPCRTLSTRPYRAVECAVLSAQGLAYTKSRKIAAGDHRESFRTSRSATGSKVWPVSCSARSFNAALRESFTRPLSSIPMHLTQIMSPILTTSSVRFTRKSASSEMCTKPSLPGKTSTNAPNSLVVTTRP